MVFDDEEEEEGVKRKYKPTIDLRFYDSMAFMNESLSKLVENLSKNCDDITE